MQSIRLALVQMSVGLNKVENVKHACNLVKKAALQGANIIALPECFNSPYGTNYFPEYAEEIPGPSTDSLSDVAKQNGVFVVGGSIPERDSGGIYNTCTVFDPVGKMVAKFRKMHLFDIDIPGKITFQESKVLHPGNEFVTFDAYDVKIGLGICYDIRFAEIAQIYAAMGCQLLLYPGAFNMTTGPVHWQLLQQARALDNQLYVGTVSPARDETASYTAWGHSMLVNPWGEVVASAGAGEQIVEADLDLERMKEVRRNVPLSNQRRVDLYRRCEKM